MTATNMFSNFGSKLSGPYLGGAGPFTTEI